MMNSIAGVQTIRNEDGVIDTITIDARQYPQAVKLLKELGLIEKSPLQQEVEANPEKFMSLEEGFTRIKQDVKESWKKWKNCQ